jgi:large subunit ribosomal protein L21
MAFAVIETGGKQYRVSTGSVIRIEKLALEAGASVTFDRVLMGQTDQAPVVGAPFIDGATVVGEVIAQVQGEKLRVFTYKPKKRQRRTLGHRQQYTQVKIGEISFAPSKPAAKAKAAA